MMWNVTTGESLRKFRGHAARVNCVCFNEESTVILSGSMDGKVNVWDLRSRRNNPIQVIRVFLLFECVILYRLPINILVLSVFRLEFQSAVSNFLG